MLIKAQTQPHTRGRPQKGNRSKAIKLNVRDLLRLFIDAVLMCVKRRLEELVAITCLIMPVKLN